MSWREIQRGQNGMEYVRLDEANRALGDALPAWWLIVGVVVGFVILAIIIWILFGYPQWNVWASHKSGQADLQQARNEQQIQIAQAQSRLDAAELNKKAAIIEAQAVSEQVKVIGIELSQHDLYLKWQWIKMMEDREGETIYVPTEANLPILEATRRRLPASQEDDE